MSGNRAQSSGEMQRTWTVPIRYRLARLSRCMTWQLGVW